MARTKVGLECRTPPYIFPTMRRRHAYRLGSIAFAVALVVTARATAGEAFRPAAAATTTLTRATLTTAPHELDIGDRAAALAAKAARTAALRSAESQGTVAPLPVTEASVPATADSSAPAGPAVVTGPVAATPSPRPAAVAVATPAPPAAATPRPAVVAVATAAPTRAPTPGPTQAPAPTPAATPVATQPPAAAAPAPACAATWFCYPRLGIAGPIVPYSDCLGTTDIGDGIRSFTCLSPFYLMGHAYTQFGGVTAWQAGDVVFASGRRFVISSAFVQNSCEPPAAPIAPLSLQTSLTSGGCGRVLVVQGR